MLNWPLSWSCCRYDTVIINISHCSEDTCSYVNHCAFTMIKKIQRGHYTILRKIGSNGGSFDMALMKEYIAETEFAANFIDLEWWYQHPTTTWYWDWKVTKNEKSLLWPCQNTQSCKPYWSHHLSLQCWKSSLHSTWCSRCETRSKGKWQLVRWHNHDWNWSLSLCWSEVYNSTSSC